MSTLNLKQYLAKIDTLLEDEYYDEAIFHSRHILSLLPKNLATYRRLGRAEVGASRWDEAHNTLRRILSFAPDDKMAHIGLSKVYQRTKKQDEALWHLERAYEQDPNNEAIINELRDLYQAYKNIANVRLQLTAGAVGRQYAKNQLYPQAIQVLKNALKQTPQRVDLRLMLARVYRESGDVVAAAETSLDVLDVLPDCLDANYIMTEVWLSEQRPSDAQRYLSVVEALDPYLAIRLAQGHAAPDDLVELPEADYKKIGQTLSDQKPDWLTQIDDGQHPVIELEDEDWSAGEVNDPTLRLNTEQLLDIDLDDDDLSWLDEPTSPVGAEETHIPENTRKRSGLTGMLTKFDGDTNEQSAVPTEEINFDDLFGADTDETPDEPDDVMAWLTDTPSETTDEDDAIHASDKHDPLGWLKESGIEIVDNNALSTDMLNRTKAPTQALDPNDPMSWLHASGIELTDEPSEDVFTPYEKVDSTTLKSADDDDPMAWLRDSGVEMTDETPLQKNFAEDDDSMFASDTDDPMAWMRGSDIEFVEENETPLPTATTPTGVSSWEDDNSLLDEMLSMEDLTGNTDSLVSALNMPSSATDEDWQDTMSENPSDDLPDWLSDSQPSGDDDFSFEDTNDEETPDWLMDMKPTEANFDPNATNIALDFGDADEEADADDTPDWLADMKPAETPVAEDDFDFLSDDTLDEAVATDTPDWLADMKPAQTPVAEDDFDFLSDDTFEEAVAEDETPDWLSGVAPITQTTFDPEATNIGMNFADLKQETDDDLLMTDDELVTEDETPDWLSGMGTASTEDDELEEEDTPDWLSGISDPSVEETSEDNFAFTELSNDAVAETDDDTPDWLSGMGAVASTENDDELEEEDTPDWLSGVSTPSTEETTEDDFAFAELSDDAVEDDETPDWLSGMGAVASIEDEQPEEEDTPDWLSGISDPSVEETSEDNFAFTELSNDAVAETDDDTPDWLSGMGAVASIEDEQPEEEDTPDWLTSMSAEDESTEESDDAFSFAGLTDEDESTEESDDAFSFAELTDEQPEEEETPAWLTSMSSDADETTEEAEDAFSFAELTDELTEDEETPDWLTSMKPVEATIEDAEADLDFLSDDLGDDDLVTADTPDWLMDSRPQEETDRDLDWLAEEEDEKSPVAEETPSWLSGLDDDNDQISEEESTTWFTEEEAPVGEFDETVPVLAGIATSGLGDEVTSLHTPAENAPDWLNALVPGLDIDYDADEDAQVEQSFLSEEAIAAASAKFAWLSKIVEAEVNLPPMTMPSATTIVKPEAPTPTTTSAPKRTWAFSRPPAWLGKSQPQSTGIKPISQVQNTPSPTATSNGSNDDDDDLPDWLRDDNDDEPDFLRDNF